jgi:hypothetical protein
MSKFSNDRFLQDCGGARPLKLLIEDSDKQSQTTIVFQQPSILIGQSELADCRLLHPTIGKRHLYLQLLNGRLFGLVLSERMTVQWGNEARSSGWISEDDMIGFGPYTVRVLEGIESPADDSPSNNPLVTSGTQEPALCLTHHADPAKPFRGSVNRALTLIGNSELCKFRIHSNRVSRVHCSLVRTRDGFWMTDLGGQDGFRLNNMSCRTAKLEEGDSFVLGGIEYRVHYQSASHITSLAPARSSRPASISGIQQPAETSIASNSVHELSLPTGQELIERMIGTIFDQFTEMQKNTLQQFQDLLGSLVQKFDSMLQLQQASANEEMNQFNRLTEELVDFRREQQASASEEMMEFNRLTAELASIRSEQQASASEEMKEFDRLTAELASIRREQQTLASAEVNQFDRLTAEWASMRRELHTNSSESAPLAEELSLPTAEEISPIAPASQHSKPEPKGDPNGPVTDGQMHIWLQSRIAELNKKRNTLLGRLIGLIRGDSVASSKR